MSAPNTSRASTRTCGRASVIRASSCGRVSQTHVNVYASRRVPDSPRAAALTRSVARSTAARTRRQSARNTAPSRVSSTCREVRRIKVTPRERSSALICWLTACWATCRSSAARVKLRHRATAIKVRRWRNSRPESGVTPGTVRTWPPSMRGACSARPTKRACSSTTRCAC